MQNVTANEVKFVVFNNQNPEIEIVSIKHQPAIDEDGNITQYQHITTTAIIGGEKKYHHSYVHNNDWNDPFFNVAEFVKHNLPA